MYKNLSEQADVFVTVYSINGDRSAEVSGKVKFNDIDSHCVYVEYKDPGTCKTLLTGLSYHTDSLRVPHNA